MSAMLSFEPSIWSCARRTDVCALVAVCYCCDYHELLMVFCLPASCAWNPVPGDWVPAPPLHLVFGGAALVVCCRGGEKSGRAVALQLV